MVLIGVSAGDGAFAFFGFGDLFGEGDGGLVELGFAVFAAECDGDLDGVVRIDVFAGDGAFFVHGTGEGGEGGEADGREEGGEEFHGGKME